MIDQNDNGFGPLELCGGFGMEDSAEPIRCSKARDGAGERHDSLRDMLLLFHADFALFPKAGNCDCSMGDGA